MQQPTQASVALDRWIDQKWLRDNWSSLARAARDHLLWSSLAFAIGFGVAIVLVMLGRRWRPLDPPVRALALVASAVPAISVLSSLVPSVTSRPALIGAVALSVTALVYRSTMHGLDRVDPDIVTEALTLGFSRWQRLTRVEFPLSLLAIRSGMRCAAIAALGLVAVGGPTMGGGLGKTIAQASGTDARAERIAGIVLLAILCVLVDFAVRMTIRPAKAVRAHSGYRLGDQPEESAALGDALGPEESGRSGQ
jgi:osmoprotectant transport system permease protein